MSDRRFDASQAARLDDPARLVWLPPREVMEALAVRDGATIADIGAGTGYFSLPLAQASGASGLVYAVDSQLAMLEHLRRKLNGQTGIIEPVHAEASATTLPPASCDLAFLANVWHEFPDRRRVVRECRRILKEGGRIAILDWRPDVEREAGPPLDHRLSAEDAAEALAAEGFTHITRGHTGKYAWLVQATLLER